MAAPLVMLALMLSALTVALRRRRLRRPARAVIVSPRKSASVAGHGSVRSIQTAELTLEGAELERLWIPANLENLARTYWRFLSKVTLGLIRVTYGVDTRSVVLLSRPLTLLRFAAPEYTIDGDHASVRWEIRDGLLVARAGRGSGYLALEVTREPAGGGGAKLLIEVEVSNFYPSIAVGFSMPVYEMTQSAVHVLVTHAFLRSLSKLELAESKVGRLAEQPGQPRQPGHP